jgi:hypothetical protein
VFEASTRSISSSCWTRSATTPSTSCSSGIDADDRARLLDEMPAKVAKRLLANLPDYARENTNLLLGYPEESAGRMMSPRYVSVRASHDGIGRAGEGPARRTASA